MFNELRTQYLPEFLPEFRRAGSVHAGTTIASLHRERACL